MHIPIREIDHVVIRCAEPLMPWSAFISRRCWAVRVEKEQRELGLVQMRAGRSLDIDLLAVGAKIDRQESGTPGAGNNMDHLCLRVEPFDSAAFLACTFA